MIYPSAKWAVSEAWKTTFCKCNGTCLDGGSWHFPLLQKLELIVRSGYDVSNFEIDKTGLLKEGQWAFSLAPSPYIFRDVADDGVITQVPRHLWNVTFGMVAGKSPTQVLAKLNVDHIEWDIDRWQFRIKKTPTFRGNHREKVLLVGGDGKTYVRPKFRAG